jgi:hypothetical protein
MTRKQQAEKPPVKPRFNPVRSLQNAGVSVGYLVLAIVIVALAPFLWVFLFGKGIRDALAKAADARVQRRAERGSRRNKKA